MKLLYFFYSMDTYPGMDPASTLLLIETQCI